MSDVKRTLTHTDMISVLQEMDVTLPPWRDAAAMLSKWQPRRSINMDFDMEGGDVSTRSASAAVAPVSSPEYANKHARRHSSGRASPRGVGEGGAIGAASAGLGTRSASQVTAAGWFLPHARALVLVLCCIMPMVVLKRDDLQSLCQVEKR